MKKLTYALLLLVLSVSFYSAVFVGKADAAARKPANCGTRSLENGAVTGYGSTSAHVKVVIWVACDGGYYASAYSTRDSNGFLFAGNLYYGAYTTTFGHVWTETETINCTQTACDSKELYNVDPTSVMHGFYHTYNGSFYSCGGNGECILPYDLEADHG
jgi:hypothetical protein